MVRSIKTPSRGDQYVGVVEVGQGGFGKTTAAESLAAIGGISKDLIGQPLGPIPLLADGTIDPKYVEGMSFDSICVDGETSILINTSHPYFLTTYDSYETYVIESIGGEAVQNQNVITYTAGNVPGIGGFTINGRLIPIAMVGSIVNAPSILSPVKGGTDVTLALSITCSAFATIGDSDVQVSSDWELSTDASFATITQSSYDSSNNLTTWAVDTMKEYTKYYVRTRHAGAKLGKSAWSKASAFITGSNGQLDEWGKFYAADGATGDSFARSTALNADATLALIGAVAGDDRATDAGSVYVFTRPVGSPTWTQQQKLTASDGAASDYFGHAVALNADATIAFVGTPFDDDRGADAGSVYVYVRTLGTNHWTQQQKLYASDAVAGDYFGISVAMNADASIAFIGACYDDDKGLDSGSVYVFTRVGSVWTQQQKLTANDEAAGDTFGGGVALNADATIAFIGAQCDDDKGNDSGSVYVFTRDSGSSAWAQQQKLHASDGVAGDYFGIAVALNAEGTLALIGAFGDDDKAANTGSVYVFTRTAGTAIWTQRQKLHASDAVANDGFGISVAVSADASIALIGAQWCSDKGTNAGAVYFFQ